jgi:hypothetical protein
MNSRVTCALVAVLVILAGIAYATNRPGTSTVQGTPTPNMAVFSFQPSDVKTLKIDYQGKSVTVEQTGGNVWKLTDPPAQYSDSTHIAGVVATFANMQKDTTVDMGQNSPATFGLDKPYLTATATLNDNSQKVLVVGNKNPGQSGYYAQVQGQPGLFIAPLVDVDSMAQLVTQPPIATPTPPSTPLATPASIPSPAPTPTPGS